jgi:gliding motility-associated-like protein
LANPPVVNDDLIYIGCEETYLMVIENDQSVDGDQIEICGYTQPANGTVWADVGLMLYTPNPGFTGTDTFTYMACDEQGAADSGTVTVVVECDAPCVDTTLEACTRVNTPVDLCVTFCTPDAFINDIISTYNANVMQLNNTCFRYIASFDNTQDALSVSYCDDAGVCETIMVNIDINADCANPGFGGQPVPEIEQEEKCAIHFPSGFSPNGDGINEVFRPLDAVHCYENAMAEVKIFNSQGRLLCESYDELGQLSWNGKLGNSNEQVLPGTYFYVITVEEETSKETFTGFVELR